MPHTAFEQLCEANPVPDPADRRGREVDLAPLVESVLLESQTRDLEPVDLEPSPRPPRWGWIVAASGAAVVVLIVLLLVIPQAPEPEVADTVPAPTVPLTPTDYTIEAFDFGFSGVPAQMTVGSALELVNSSTTEFHNLGVSKLPDEETRTVEELMALPPEAFYSDSAGIGSLKVDLYVGIIHARPGQAAYDGRIRINTAGRFLLVDLVRQGSDPAAVEAAVAEDSSPLQVPGGLVGYQQGMIAIIEVVE